VVVKKNDLPMLKIVMGLVYSRLFKIKVAGMKKYYVYEYLLKPYSFILKGGGCNLSFYARIVFSLRKLAKMYEHVYFAQAYPADISSLKIEDLPILLQKIYREKIDEAERHDFKSVLIYKDDIIGYKASYKMLLINKEKDVLLKKSTVLYTHGPKEKIYWTTELRTVLKDDVCFITCQMPKLKGKTIKSDNKVEFMPDSYSLDKMINHHQERINQIQNTDKKLFSEDNILDFIKDRNKREHEALIATGCYRELMENEVNRLDKIEYDFK
jgi:hypothetical protein